jgi:hypothetical protein
MQNPASSIPNDQEPPQLAVFIDLRVADRAGAAALWQLLPDRRLFPDQEADMKTAVIALLLVTLALPAMAQGENFQVYFDDNYTQGAADCPGVGVLDTLYVVANNLNMFFTAAEFSVSLPAQLTWLADIPNTPLAIGNTQSGVAYSWTLPQNGFASYEICQILVTWNCDDCAGVVSPGWEVVVNRNLANPPAVTQPRVTRYPDIVLIDVIGNTSLICAQVPVEETSWGKLKALYDVD